MLTLIRRFGKWLFIFLFLVFCVVFLVIFAEPKREGPFWDKYQQIRVGMSDQDAYAILGPRTGGFDSSFSSIDMWEEGSQTIIIKMGTAPSPGKGIVVRKEFLPRSRKERLIDWWNEWSNQ
jgi:hypothetical protein